MLVWLGLFDLLLLLLSIHRAVIFLGRRIAILVAHAWIFVNLARLLVFVEDRLCSRIVNLQLIRRTSNRISL